MILIRRLLPQEHLVWKNFRILALSEDPDSFFSYSSVEDEIRRTNREIQEQLEKQLAAIDEVTMNFYKMGK